MLGSVRVVLIVLGVLCVAMPVHAVARPKSKVAVAPFDGDNEDQVAQAVADAFAGKDYTVVGPRDTGNEMIRLGIEELDAKASRKLAKRLGAVAVIAGKLGKAGRKRSLRLEVHRRGKADAGLTLEFKSSSSGAFRRAVREALSKKLDEGGESDAGEEDDEPAATPFARSSARSSEDRPSRAADDERARKRDRPERTEDTERAATAERAAQDRPRSEDSEETRPARAASEPGRRGKRAAVNDDERAGVRKRKRKATSEEPAQVAPRVLARVGGGASMAQRSLSFETRAGFTQIPPNVSTTGGAGRIDGELYPFAIADASSSLAPLGLALSYDKTFGVTIPVPNQTVSAPINQSHYAIGARYRFAIGEASSFTVGLDYERRQYIADRTALGTAVLDTPDVDYTALAPSAGLRFPVTDTVIAFAAANFGLVLDAGAIANNANYGAADAYGIGATGGVDIMFTSQIGLRVAAELSQMTLAFTANAATKTMANNRDNDPTTQDVNGATDRLIGLAVTLGLSY